MGNQRTLFVALALAGPAVAQVGPHHRFTFRGEAALDGLGTAVAVLGDLDGDGHAEVAVGAPQPMQLAPGYVSVLSGANGTELYRVLGDTPSEALGDRFGASLCALDDVDGDGVGDFAVGAPEDDASGLETGAVSVHSGVDGALLRRYDGLFEGERFGASLAAGDVDGDGVLDLCVGAPGGALHAGGVGGRIEVLSGGWLAEQLAGQGTTGPESLWSAAGPAGFGTAVAVLGDVAGGGAAEVAVGSPAEGVGGAVVVLDGGSGAEVLRLTVAQADADLGRTVAGLGDLDGDGVPELVAGAPSFGSAGRVWVVDGAGLGTLTGAQDVAAVSAQFIVDGTTLGERFGSALAGGGDPDGDGVPDLAVGANDGATTAGSGRAVVYSGATGAVLFGLDGTGAGALGGWSLALGGDVDLDGRGDLVVGLPRVEGARGAATVLSGGAATLVTDAHLLALDVGGTVAFELWGGAARASDFYILVGSASGTQPGTPVAGVVLPLVADVYTFYSLASPPEQQGFVGVLDSGGNGTASIVLPPESPPQMAGLTVHFAWLGLEPAPGLPGTLASNAVPVTLGLDGCTVFDPALDCNDNGVLDACDILTGLAVDCDGNGVPDACDLATGAAADLDLDGIVDSCQQVVYVDAQAFGSNDGSSWFDAYTDLATALAVAPEFGQVWVAAGLYRPGPFPSPPETTFVLRDRVGLYGGFAGGEQALAERDPAANPTILDGDLAGDDDLIGGSLDDNVWSVVTAPATNDSLTTLDGFVVRRGSADALSDCDGVIALFDKCRGAGLYCLGAPMVRDCVFEECFAVYNGGAVYIGSDAAFVRCTFRANIALRGAGAYVDLGAEPDFVNCHFVDNAAQHGAGLYVNGNSGEGARVVGSVLHANGAGTRAGAIFVTGGHVELIGSTVTYNSSLGSVGGLGGEFGATWQIDGTLLWGNQGAGGGGGEGAQLDGLGASLGHSCVEGWTGALGGSGNFGANPLLSDPDGADGVLGTADDDVSLASGSPCIDAGDALAIGLDVFDLDADGDTAEPLPLDAAGLPRGVNVPGVPDTGVAVFGITPDVGAYERQGP